MNCLQSKTFKKKTCRHPSHTQREGTGRRWGGGARDEEKDNNSVSKLEPYRIL